MAGLDSPYEGSRLLLLLDRHEGGGKSCGLARSLTHPALDGPLSAGKNEIQDRRMVVHES